MKKQDLIAAAGSPSKLADILGITRQAVSYWGDEVPMLQQYRIKELRPAWFRKGGKMRLEHSPANPAEHGQ